MSKTRKSEHNYALQALGVIVFLVGLILLFLFPIGTLVGIVLMVAAGRMGFTRRKVWQCGSCGYFFERAS